MRLDVVKCHGSGNAFPMVDARDIALDDEHWAGIARALADRRGPVGGDGLLALTTANGDYAFGFRMWNSDGSESETCLNGLRCVARMGFEALGISEAVVRLKTSSVTVRRDDDLAAGVYTVRETAGPAILGAVEQVIPQLPSDRRFTAVAMPNPHLIAFGDIDVGELVRAGLACEAAPAWLPNRANVSFVEMRGANLFVRTHERGVGLTDSCGSAMAASTFAACVTGRIAFGTAITVFNAGGRVRACAEQDGMVTLSGNATFEWAGSAEVDAARGTAGDLVISRHFPNEIAAWARVLEPA